MYQAYFPATTLLSALLYLDVVLRLQDAVPGAALSKS